MVNPTRLETVTKAFRQWRFTRSAGSNTPKSLQQQAVSLLAHYPATQVIKALGTNSVALKRWQDERDDTPLHDTPRAPAFIPLQGMLTPPASEPAIHVTLEHPNGTCLTVQGALSPQHLAALAASVAAPPGGAL
jgi:hypothetical protein